VARLILDTSVLVATDRARFDAERMDGPNDVAVPAIAIAEFRDGMLSNPAAAARRDSATFLDDVLDVLAVVDYTAEVAEHHAALLADSRRRGRPRGAHDLIVAASARATGRTVLTFDRRAAFADLPGVDVRVLAAAA
jgi:tRNA(fMet)-specific endonuclease VapC